MFARIDYAHETVTIGAVVYSFDALRFLRTSRQLGEVLEMKRVLAPDSGLGDGVREVWTAREEPPERPTE